PIRPTSNPIRTATVTSETTGGKTLVRSRATIAMAIAAARPGTSGMSAANGLNASSARRTGRSGGDSGAKDERCGRIGSDLVDLRRVVRGEGQRAAGLTPDPVELEGVERVHLVDEADRTDVRSSGGRRSRISSRVPEAEREARAVVRARSLEVVDEALCAGRLAVGSIVELFEPGLVRVGLADGAKGHQVPLAIAQVRRLAAPLDRVRDRQRRIALADRLEAMQRVHRA